MHEIRRRLSDLAGAIVDCASIDWRAAESRLRTDGERRLAGMLQFIERLRAAGAFEGAWPASSASGGTLVARLVAAIAAGQAAVCLTLIGAAWAAGGGATARPSQLWLALAFLIGSGFAGSRARDGRRVFLLAAFATAAGAFARSAAAGLPPDWREWMFPAATGLVPEAFTPACVCQFALDFPRSRRFSAFDRAARRLTQLAWFAGGAFFVANLAAGVMPSAATPLALLFRDDPRHAFWLFFALTLVLALAALALRGGRAPDDERRRVARLALAIAAGAGPFAISGAFWTFFPWPDHALADISWLRSWLHGVSLGALTATPLVSAAALIVDRPFDQPAVRARRLPRPAATPRAFCHPRTRICEGLVAGVLEGMRAASGVRQRLAWISEAMAEGLGSREVRHLCANGAHAFVDPLGSRVALNRTDVLAVMVREAGGPIDVSPGGPLHALLPQPARQWVAEHDIAMLAPVLLRDGSVPVILTIGARCDGRPFDAHERWAIAAVSMALAAAWRDAPVQAADAARDEVAIECPGCGCVADVPPLPCGCGRVPRLAAVPLHLGTHRLVRRLGAGGMGIVYLAHDVMLDRLVALKTLPALGPEGSARLRDEARAMAALDHESLAGIYGASEWHGVPVLHLEYFPGGTLADAISAGPLAPADVARLGVQLARGVAHMHARGVRHGDIKPSNIGLTASGVPRLLDFGLARAIAAEGLGTTGGTFAYLPPEALDGAPVTEAFDLWALALVLLEAVQGRPIRGRSAVARAMRSWRASSAAAGQGDRLLTAVLETALARAPRDRFQTADDLRRALERALAAFGLAEPRA